MLDLEEGASTTGEQGTLKFGAEVTWRALCNKSTRVNEETGGFTRCLLLFVHV